MSSLRTISSDRTCIITNSSRNLHSEKNSNIKKYVEEFKKEVETKYNKSQTNKNFKFPRKKKTIKKKYSNEKDKSFNSLENVKIYDLEAENTKRNILKKMENNKDSGRLLTFIIKQMGKLNKDYLDSQFQTDNSDYFKILLKGVMNIQNNNKNFLNKAKKTKNKVFKFQKKLNRKSTRKTSSKKLNQSIKKAEKLEKIEKNILKKLSNEINPKKIKYILKNKEVYLNFDTKKINNKNNIKSNYTPHTSRTSMIKKNKNAKSSSINRKKSKNKSKKSLSKKLVKSKNLKNTSQYKLNKQKSDRISNYNKTQSILDTSAFSKKKIKKIEIKGNKKINPLTFTKEQLNSLINKNFKTKNLKKKYIEIQNPLIKNTSSSKRKMNIGINLKSLKKQIN